MTADVARDLEGDIYIVEEYLKECEDLEVSMGLYNLLSMLLEWRYNASKLR